MGDLGWAGTSEWETSAGPEPVSGRTSDGRKICAAGEIFSSQAGTSEWEKLTGPEPVNGRTVFGRNQRAERARNRGVPPPPPTTVIPAPLIVVVCPQAVSTSDVKSPDSATRNGNIIHLLLC